MAHVSWCSKINDIPLKNLFFTSAKRSQYRFVVVLLFFVIAICGFLGEKVAREDGAGWDGVTYREMARSAVEDIPDRAYSAYQLQRVAPFALINWAYRAFSLPLDNDSLMYGMVLLQLLAMGCAIWIYFKISDRLSLSVAAELLGFALLFYNYPCLKYVEYYPFLTDIFAYQISLLFFYFFLTGRRVWLLLSALVGAFVWPTLFGIGITLALLPAIPFDLSSDKPLSKAGKWFLRLLRIGALAGIPVLLGAIYYMAVVGKKHASLKDLFWCTDYGSPLLLVLSLLATSLFLFELTRSFRFDIKELAEKVKKEITPRVLISLLGVFLIPKLLIGWLDNGDTGWDFPHMLLQTVLRSVTAPGVFLVNHFVFYGLIPVFLILYWRPFVRAVSRYGMAYWLILAEFIFLSVNSESRYLIYLLPFIALPLLQILDREKWLAEIVVPVALFSLLKSMFWFPINVEGISESFLAGNYGAFPAQRYFMMHGPWQNHAMYLLFGVLALGVYFGIRSFINKR